MYIQARYWLGENQHLNQCPIFDAYMQSFEVWSITWSGTWEDPGRVIYVAQMVMIILESVRSTANVSSPRAMAIANQRIHLCLI